jgi:hypothetical protein
MFLAWTQWIALLLVLLLAGASVALTALTDAGGETSVTDQLPGVLRCCWVRSPSSARLDAV